MSDIVYTCERCGAEFQRAFNVMYCAECEAVLHHPPARSKADYAALESRLTAAEQARDVAQVDLHLAMDALTAERSHIVKIVQLHRRAITNLGALLHQWRLAAYGLGNDLATAEARTLALAERLESFGRLMDDDETCGMCRDETCKDAIVSTCIGWLARHTLATLDPALTAVVEARARERAILHELAGLECVSGTRFDRKVQQLAQRARTALGRGEEGKA